MQGFLTAKFVAGKHRHELKYSFNKLSLTNELCVLSSLAVPTLTLLCHCFRKHHRLYLSESLRAEELKILVDVGLKERFPNLCDAWERQEKEVHAIYQQKLIAEQHAAKAKIAREAESLQYVIHKAIVIEVLRKYP